MSTDQIQSGIDLLAWIKNAPRRLSMLRKTLGFGATALAIFAAVLLPAAPAAADSGGGCQNSESGSHPRVCISVQSGQTDPLWGDAYLDSAYSGETQAWLQIVEYCTNTGTYYYNQSAYWSPPVGHSPLTYVYKHCSAGYGRAWTTVIFRDWGLTYLYSAVSPVQYF